MNNPNIFSDPLGLEVRVYSSDAWGLGLGLNHTYVYSSELGYGKGANGSSIVGELGDGVTDTTSQYKIVKLPNGMTESNFMNKIQEAPNWNNGLYLPFVNDCHNDLERAFDYAEVPYPGAPQGRFDWNENLYEVLTDLLNMLPSMAYQ